MRIVHRIGFLTATAFLLLAALAAGEQKKSKPERIQAQAMGQLTHTGRQFNITITIEQYSTEEEQQKLLATLVEGGQPALVKLLERMKPKGRVAITGTLGYDAVYIRQFPTETGRRIRILTNRPIRFAEAWADSRSGDYDLSALQLDLSNTKGASRGVLMPLCQIKIKQQQLELEAYQSAWQLVNVIEWD